MIRFFVGLALLGLAILALAGEPPTMPTSTCPCQQSVRLVGVIERRPIADACLERCYQFVQWQPFGIRERIETRQADRQARICNRRCR